jgi:DNA-directed RNA polymerase subunit RPC12/RpoP
MIIYSKTYPGCIYICEECGCLFGIDPQKDIYEEKYVYCPLCHYKMDSGIHDAEWRYAVEHREEAQPNDEENSNSNGGADSSSTTDQQDGSSGAGNV